MSQPALPLAIVAGAGPGLGRACCECFRDAGYRVVGLSRSLHEPFAEGVEMRQIDLSDPNAVVQVFEELEKTHGLPKVLIHNPSELVIAPFLETSAEQFSQAWRSMVLSAALTSQQAINRMLRNKGGTIILSGATASVKAGMDFSAFASAKFALRGLAQSMAREFQSQGIQVVHVILDGIILTARSKLQHEIDEALMMKPEDIAATYLALAQQPATTWSQELDLRPASEPF